MIEVQSNKSDGLLTIVFTETVTVGEASQWMNDVKDRVAALAPGFRLLADLSRLDSMEIECAPIIARVMDICNDSGVSKVIRIIPDPRKDIGLRILSLFHYDRDVRILTVRDRGEAEAAL